MNILGISAFYHDSAAALVQDGRITAAAQEERFSRKKHDQSFPADAIRYVLAEAGLEGYARVACDDALVWLERTAERFDFVFMDIEKEDYIKALPGLENVIAPGGLLVADNVAFEDADPFNCAMFRNPAWRSVSLHALLPGHSPRYDGLCLAVRTA